MKVIQTPIVVSPKKRSSIGGETDASAKMAPYNRKNGVLQPTGESTLVQSRAPSQIGISRYLHLLFALTHFYLHHSLYIEFLNKIFVCAGMTGEVII
ncbi:MAG TPA: hypothetical protein VJ810_16045 [Blastocatellia bacterium]|nr:hypothetical protein [Blastocatellia bacterium]